jgi:hypothetical protein
VQYRADIWICKRLFKKSCKPRGVWQTVNQNNRQGCMALAGLEYEVCYLAACGDNPSDLIEDDDGCEDGGGGGPGSPGGSGGSGPTLSPGSGGGIITAKTHL